MSVSRTISIIGQEPTERHVGLLVIPNDLLRGEFVRELLGLKSIRRDRGAVAVQGLAHHAAVGAIVVGVIALLVFDFSGLARGLAVLRLPLCAAAGLAPAVTVVCIQMPQVEGILRQKHRVAGYVKIAVENILSNRCARSTVRKEIVGVKLIFLVGELYLRGISLAKVIGARLEGVAKHAIAVAGPIERVRRGNTAIDPIVGIGNLDGLALMGKTTVLGTTAEEELLSIGVESLNG